MRCEQCNERVGRKANFCAMCGTPVAKPPAEAEQKAAQLPAPSRAAGSRRHKQAAALLLLGGIGFLLYGLQYMDVMLHLVVEKERISAVAPELQMSGLYELVVANAMFILAGLLLVVAAIRSVRSGKGGALAALGAVLLAVGVALVGVVLRSGLASGMPFLYAGLGVVLLGVLVRIPPAPGAEPEA